MPRMSNTRRAISMTRFDTWTTIEPNIKSETIADFCLNHCPHKETPCNGDCLEMKEFRKNRRKENNGKH